MEKFENMTVKTCPVTLAPNLKAISIACSKDPARYNLTSVYKDRGVLVATDGYRLNFVKVVKDDASSGYLDGRTGVEFPDYGQAIPETWSSEAALTLYKDTIDKLKALEKLAKLADKNIRITLEEKKTSFDLVGETLTAHYEIESENRTVTPGFTVTIKLAYFLEFVEAFKASMRTRPRNSFLNVTLRASDNPLSPIMVEIEDHYSIIMPIRAS